MYYSRIDTFVGACITQLIMTAVIITTAKTWDGNFPSKDDLQTEAQFADKLGDIMGPFAGKFLFALGVIGGALIGAIVVALTATWSYSELIDAKRSLETSPCSAPYFYSAYVAILLGRWRALLFFRVTLSRSTCLCKLSMRCFALSYCCFCFYWLVVYLESISCRAGTNGSWLSIVFSFVSDFGVFSSFYGIFSGAL